jgi:hypothetical protein
MLDCVAQKNAPRTQSHDAPNVHSIARLMAPAVAPQPPPECRNLSLTVFALSNLLVAGDRHVARSIAPTPRIGRGGLITRRLNRSPQRDGRPVALGRLRRFCADPRRTAPRRIAVPSEPTPAGAPYSSNTRTSGMFVRFAAVAPRAGSRCGQTSWLISHLSQSPGALARAVRHGISREVAAADTDRVIARRSLHAAVSGRLAADHSRRR